MTRITTTASLLLATTIAFATQALAQAQAPSAAQRDAIKSNCRSDYIAHCSSIPPGGAASLECLQKNMSSLSASCASAVRAVEAPAAAPKAAEEPKAEPKTETKTETKAEPAPAAKEAKPAAEPKAASTAKKPSQAQISAIKSNCRSDYPKVCAGVPPGGEAALDCLEKNKAKVSAACAKAVAAVGGGGAAPAAATGGGSTGGAPAATAAAPAAAAPTVIVLRPMRPREELRVLRSACGGDVRTLCGGVAPGGGRIAQCLASQAGALSPACRDVLAQFAR
jgi:pyruvate/2-oxoglutarate dehydrogenase complex dihydrolipoamide acyltransferase (E2) component